MDENIETTIKEIAFKLGATDAQYNMWRSRKKISKDFQIKIYKEAKELPTPLTLDQVENPF